MMLTVRQNVKIGPLGFLIAVRRFKTRPQDASYRVECWGVGVFKF
jgi:hypothetical protein